MLHPSSYGLYPRHLNGKEIWLNRSWIDVLELRATQNYPGVSVYMESTIMHELVHLGYHGYGGRNEEPPPSSKYGFQHDAWDFTFEAYSIGEGTVNPFDTGFSNDDDMPYITLEEAEAELETERREARLREERNREWERRMGVR